LFDASRPHGFVPNANHDEAVAITAPSLPSTLAHSACAILCFFGASLVVVFGGGNSKSISSRDLGTY